MVRRQVKSKTKAKPRRKRPADDTIPVPTSGGRGEPVYLTPVQENKITSLMIHANRRLWPIEEKHELEAVEKTVLNISNPDGRVSNGAVKNLVAMKAQNLAIERGDPANVQNQLNIGTMNVNGPMVLNITEEVVDRAGDDAEIDGETVESPAAIPA